MKKFNALEADFLEKGLKLYIKSVCEDIKIAESEGKRPIMTVDYMEMIEKTKGNAIDEYVPTDEEIKNYETLKNKLIALQREREPQFQEAPNQQERDKLEKARDKLEKARDELEEASFPLGGGSKYKRQSKRRKQRNQQKRRQKSKKYCK